MQLDNVTVSCRANVYFGGRVISYSLITAAGQQRTMGVIYPGTYRFDMQMPLQIAIVGGACHVRIGHDPNWQALGAGESADVPAGVPFEVSVQTGITEYMCTF